jgi:four helix bundle protein
MQFGHEQLDVYRVSIRYVAWAYETAKRLRGMDRHARDQLVRAAQSVPLHIADGNGKLRCKNKLDSLSAWVSSAS